jgi:hypothetical protein
VSLLVGASCEVEAEGGSQKGEKCFQRADDERDEQVREKSFSLIESHQTITKFRG